MAHVTFRPRTTLMVVVNMQLVIPSSSSFGLVCSSPPFFFFLFLSLLSVVWTITAPSWSSCFVWFLQSYFVCTDITRVFTPTHFLLLIKCFHFLFFFTLFSKVFFFFFLGMKDDNIPRLNNKARLLMGRQTNVVYLPLFYFFYSFIFDFCFNFLENRLQFSILSLFDHFYVEGLLCFLIFLIDL